MQVRRERVHYHGKTNRDYQLIDKLNESEKSEEFQRSRIVSLAAPKTKKFIHMLEEKHTRITSMLDPTLETMKSAPKKFVHHEVGYPRQSQLEETRLRKRVFCGDSNTLYMSGKAKVIQSESTQMSSDKLKLATQKIEENAKGIQETQLVGLENKTTLEGKVDLEKVRDIKRAIRRRYANRKNFQKIFNLWDEDANGAISVKNLYNMVQKLGITINTDEAHVLLASADKDKSNDLKLDEFLDLIFNDKDVLNINLKQLEPEEGLQRIQILQQDAQKARQRKHNNQVNLMLKNRQVQLRNWLKQADQANKGCLTQQQFEEVISKLQIDKNILSQADVKELARNFLTSENQIDYKQFMGHLQQFQITEEIYDDPYATKSDKKLIRIKKTTDQQQCHVFDPTKVNGWHLERMRFRANNMINKLKKYIPEKEKFDELMEEKLKGNTVNLNDFKKLVDQFFNNVNETYHKFDIESLLSVIQFNQYQTQSKQEIGRILYEEDDDQFFERAQQQVKQPPPPQNIAKLQGIQECATENLEKQQLHSYYDRDMGMQSVLPNHNKDVMDILLKVENGIFNKRENQYKTFKDFDMDKDGYISQVDLAERLKHTLTQNEISTLIKHIDPENQGFLNFTDFTKKIRNGMTILDQQGTQIVNVNTQPSKTTLLAATNFLPELQRSVQEVKKSYIPSRNRSDYKPSTRYGATPEYKDTFCNFVPMEKSGLYAASDARFSKNREDFLQEEKQRREFIQEEKMARIRNYQESIRDRIKSQDERHSIRDENHLKSKAIARQAYESSAKSKNYDYQ